MNHRKKLIFAICGLGLLLLVGWLLSPVWSTVNTLSQRGFFESREGTAKFTGGSTLRLKAQHTALMMYHESEDRFPFANGWMEETEKRMSTADLKDGEAKKKLTRPDLESKEGAYGYSLNRAASGKYKKEVGTGDPILVFESVSEKKNAEGDPKTDGVPGGLAITVEGKISKLPSKP